MRPGSSSLASVISLMVKGSLVFNNKIYLKKYNRRVLLFIGSYSSPRLLVSNWSTIEKTKSTTILTFPFSLREESLAPSTKGRIKGLSPLSNQAPPLCLLPLPPPACQPLPPRPLPAPPCCPNSSSSLVTTTLGTTGWCHSALLFIGICAWLVWICMDSLHSLGRPSGNFPDGLETFQVDWKLSRPPGRNVKVPSPNF